jgi:drug/metabolite transporter (DMT)-like permease
VRRDEVVGGVLVGAASMLFGSVVVFGKYALQGDMTVSSMLAIRFAIGAVLLLGALVVTRRPLVAARGERTGIVILAVCGYAVEASFFFAAVRHGTAAAVTLLFLTYPVMVTFGAWALGRGAPGRRTIAALAFAVGGVAIVVGAGEGLAVEPVGAVLALGAAVTYTAYLLGADGVLRATEPMTGAAWVSGAASIALFAYAFAFGEWVAPVGWSGWWPILGTGAATAGAFVCLLAGLRRIGAVRTSIVATTEPLSSALLAWVFLDEAVTPAVVAGGALILTGAVIASLARAATAPEQQIP